MRRFSLLLGLLAWALCCALAPVAEAAQEPLLTLLYTANSEGNYRPCAVCGAQAQGGLARRSTVFDQARSQAGGRTLAIAGGYEFVPFRQPPAAKDVASGLVKAYSSLHYDLGLLTQKEGDWLRDGVGGLGAAWVQAGEEPQQRVLTVGGLKVGVVVFPASPTPYEVPSDALIEAVVASSALMRAQCDLVVGLGAWGRKGEEKLLSVQELDMDVLLGSGPGIGAGARMVREGRSLLLRSEFQGRSVLRLDIFELPIGNTEQRWSKGVNYLEEIIVLDPNVSSDPRITDILAWI